MMPAAEAARRRGRTPAWLRALCAAGRVPGAEKLGRDWFVPKDFNVISVPRGRPPLHGR